MYLGCWNDMGIRVGKLGTEMCQKKKMRKKRKKKFKWIYRKETVNLEKVANWPRVKVKQQEIQKSFNKSKKKNSPSNSHYVQTRTRRPSVEEKIKTLENNQAR